MTGVGGPMFEIRLENEVIVLYGVESEAASQVLRGVLALHLTSPLKVDNICLQMTGKWRIGWNDRVGTTWVPIHFLDRSTEIFNYEWPPFLSSSSNCSSKGTMLMPGKYEWPFEIEISGSTSETVEGLDNSYVLYKLKATITRGGRGSAMLDFKPVRIIRALDLAALGLAGPRTVAGTWTDKVDYRISIPQSAVAIGSSVTVHMSIKSLLRDLRIGIVRCVLYESQEYTLPTPIAAKGLKRLKPVGRWNIDPTDRNQFPDLTGLEPLEEHVFNVVLPLPNRLRCCVQDTDVCGIRICHMVKAGLELYSPDGHITELRATLPVTIFIPPDTIFDFNGCVSPNLPCSEAGDGVRHEPPLYCEHSLDHRCLRTDPFMTFLPETSSTHYTTRAELSAEPTQLDRHEYGTPSLGYNVDSAGDDMADRSTFGSEQPNRQCYLGDFPSTVASSPRPTSPELPTYEVVNPMALGSHGDELRELSNAYITSWAEFEPEAVDVTMPEAQRG